MTGRDVDGLNFVCLTLVARLDMLMSSVIQVFTKRHRHLIITLIATTGMLSVVPLRDVDCHPAHLAPAEGAWPQRPHGGPVAFGLGCVWPAWWPTPWDVACERHRYLPDSYCIVG